MVNKIKGITTRLWISILVVIASSILMTGVVGATSTSDTGITEAPTINYVNSSGQSGRASGFQVAGTVTKETLVETTMSNGQWLYLAENGSQAPGPYLDITVANNAVANIVIGEGPVNARQLINKSLFTIGSNATLNIYGETDNVLKSLLYVGVQPHNTTMGNNSPPAIVGNGNLVINSGNTILASGVSNQGPIVSNTLSSITINNGQLTFNTGGNSDYTPPESAIEGNSTRVIINGGVIGCAAFDQETNGSIISDIGGTITGVNGSALVVANDEISPSNIVNGFIVSGGAFGGSTSGGGKIYDSMEYTGATGKAYGQVEADWGGSTGDITLGSLDIPEGSSVTTGNGEEITVTGASTVNGDLNTEDGTTVTLDGNTTVGPRGSIDNFGTMDGAGTITNDGSITNGNGKTMANPISNGRTGKIVNAGEITGQVNNTAGGQVVQSASGSMPGGYVGPSGATTPPTMRNYDLFLNGGQWRNVQSNQTKWSAIPNPATDGLAGPVYQTTVAANAVSTDTVTVPNLYLNNKSFVGWAKVANADPSASTDFIVQVNPQTGASSVVAGTNASPNYGTGSNRSNVVSWQVPLANFNATAVDNASVLYAIYTEPTYDDIDNAYVTGINLQAVQTPPTYYNVSYGGTGSEQERDLNISIGTRPYNNLARPSDLEWSIAPINSTTPIITFPSTWSTPVYDSATGSYVQEVSDSNNNWTLKSYYTTNVTGPGSNSSLRVTYTLQGMELVYTGLDGAQFEPGFYQLTATAPEPGAGASSVISPTYQEPSTSVRFRVIDSSVEEVTIVNGNGSAIPNNEVTVNIADTRTMQFGYRALNDQSQVVTGNQVKYSIELQPEGDTDNYAFVNETTGLVTFFKPLPENTVLELNLNVDGVGATNTIYIYDTATGSSGNLTGIEAVKDPLYVGNDSTYNLVDNIQGIPTGYYVDPEQITWTSSNSEIQVSSFGDTAVIVAPYSGYTGTSTITASIRKSDGTVLSTSFVVNVTNPVIPTGLTAVETINLILGQDTSANVDANFTPEDSTVSLSNENVEVTYESSNTSVAVVDATGNVYPTGNAGTCVITTTATYYNGVTTDVWTAQTTVNVIDINPEDVESLTVSPDTLALSLNGSNTTGTVTATVDPEDYANYVNWESSDVDVATVESVGSEVTVTAVGEGTCTITASLGDKTATIEVTVTEDEVQPTAISVSPETTYLAPQGTENGTVSATLTASLEPSGTSAAVTWTSTEGITLTPAEDGMSATVASTDETGTYPVVASFTGEDGTVISTTVYVVVSDSATVIDPAKSTITADSPDFYTVTVAPQVNTAVSGSDGQAIGKVSIFTWSQTGQTDLDCKVANDNGDGTWSYTFPVNNTPVNEYYIDASDITVNCYASTDQNSDGNLVWNTNWNYANCNWTEGVIATPYVQDNGFVIPSVGNNVVAGTTGQHLQMEGIRLSTQYDGVDVVYDVHVQDIGWMDQVNEGVYAGTMHQNLQMEAIHISLTGPNASQFTVQYQAHVENIGWMDWVADGAEAGTTGQNLQMEALRIQIVPAGTALPENTGN